jgi:hypothetical protein
MIRELEKMLKANRNDVTRCTVCKEVAAEMEELAWVAAYDARLADLATERRLLNARLDNLLLEANAAICDPRKVYE